MLLMPIFADQLLRVGPRGLGVLYAAQPAGPAVAGLLLASRPLPRRQCVAILWAVAAYGGALAVFGSSRSFPLSLARLASAGAGRREGVRAARVGRVGRAALRRRRGAAPSTLT